MLALGLNPKSTVLEYIFQRLQSRLKSLEYSRDSSRTSPRARLSEQLKTNDGVSFFQPCKRKGGGRKGEEDALAAHQQLKKDRV